MHLQHGTILAISNNQEDNPLCTNPVVQIFNTEKIQSTPSDGHRIKATISDSEYYIKAIFSSKYNGHFESETIKNYSIIKIASYQVRRKDKNIFLYITDLDDFWEHESLIGKPINVSNHDSGNASSKSKVDIKKENVDVKKETVDVKKSMPTTRKSVDQGESSKRSKSEFMGIASITPFNKKWTLKGRCTQKSDIRTFTNQKGEGKLFSIYLTDESGNIKITAFSECVDLFHPIFDVGKVYTVSKGTMKTANKTYSSGSTEYEIFLDKNSEVSLVLDEMAPKFFFKFIRINELALADNNVDVIGIVKETYPIQTITLKNTGKEQNKKDVLLIDETGNIKITLWGSKSEINVEKGDVMAISNVMIKEYNGISLSTMASTQIHVNPDLEECFELKGWYENDGKNMKIVRNIQEEKKFLMEIKENEFKFSTFLGTIISVKEDNLYYDACIECNKKVQMEDSNIYRCEKCNKTFDKCISRYIINIKVADFTSQIYAIIFNDQGTSLLGVTADKFKEANGDSTEIENVIKNIYFNDYIFKVAMKSENYNNEERKKYSVLEIKEIDCVTEGKKLYKSICESIN